MYKPCQQNVGHILCLLYTMAYENLYIVKHPSTWTSGIWRLWHSAVIFLALLGQCFSPQRVSVCVMMMTETASPWCTSPLQILSRQQQQQQKDDESYVDSPATLVVRTVGGSIYPNINLCGCSPLQPHVPPPPVH